MKCLIAEGDPSSRGALRESLTRYGSCDFVESSEDAFAAFVSALGKGEGYDLLVLDLDLPEAGGSGVLKAVREVERLKSLGEVPVVITAARLSPREMVGAYYYSGCTDFLVKPIRKSKVDELLVAYGLVSGEAARLASLPGHTERPKTGRLAPEAAVKGPPSRATE